MDGTPSLLNIQEGVFGVMDIEPSIISDFYSLNSQKYSHREGSENFGAKTKKCAEDEDACSCLRGYTWKGKIGPKHSSSAPNDFHSLNLLDHFHKEGWYSINNYFKSYQAKIRKEDKLEKNIDRSPMSVFIELRTFNFFFSLQEKGIFSQDETILALELFTEVKRRSINNYKGFCQEKNKPSEGYWEPFTNNIQFLDIMICLLISKTFIQDSSSLYCISVIKNLINKKGRRIRSEEIYNRQVELLKILDFNVNKPLINIYCHLLFELVGGTSLRISRLGFYETCYNMLKIYFLNRHNIMKQMCRNYFSKELISAAIVCAVVYQNSGYELGVISNNVCKQLETITEIKKEEFLKITRKLIEIINVDNLKIDLIPYV